MILRVVGDCHGCIDQPHPKKGFSYRDVIEGCDYSIQLGDMGFNYSGLDGLSCRHRFILGNHENYDYIPDAALGNFGECKHGPWEFFFVRGEWSIDVRHRLNLQAKGHEKCWWPEEELTNDQMERCLQRYREIKPSVVMSHGCPASISSLVGSPSVWKHFGWDEPRDTNTQLLMQEMFNIHQPDLWLFGHYHRNWTHIVGKTEFVCVDELSYVDFNDKWEMLK